MTERLVSFRFLCVIFSLIFTNGAGAVALKDFLYGAAPHPEVDPLQHSRLCENDLDSRWPTAVEFGQLEDLLGLAGVYVDRWSQSEDPRRFVREHQDVAVELVSRAFGMRARFDLAKNARDDGYLNQLETRMMELEAIHRFVGFVATEDELEALQDSIERALRRQSHTNEDFEAIRENMQILALQAILLDLRGTGNYQVPEELLELEQRVFVTYLHRRDR